MIYFVRTNIKKTNKKRNAMREKNESSEKQFFVDAPQALEP